MTLGMGLSAGGWLYLYEQANDVLQKWILVQLIFIVFENCLVLSLPPESYLMKSTAHDLLECNIYYDILPTVDKLKNP